jgi:hypothetical protein
MLTLEDMSSFKRRYQEAHEKFRKAVTSRQGHSPSARETAHPTAEKPQRSDDSNKNVIVEEPPPKNDHIYRVQGIPIEFEIGDVEKLLRSALNLEKLSSIEFRSLAIHHQKLDQVATVSFDPTPPLFLPSIPRAKKDNWRYTYSYGKGSERRNRTISFDTHFKGLTVLRSCPSSDHRIEYAFFPFLADYDTNL